MTIVSDKTDEYVTEIYIDSDLIEIKLDDIQIYALDSKTIGLSNKTPKLWEKECLWKAKAKILKDGKEITVIIPPEVVRFYRPKKIEIANSLEKDNILLIIS